MDSRRAIDPFTRWTAKYSGDFYFSSFLFKKSKWDEKFQGGLSQNGFYTLTVGGKKYKLRFTEDINVQIEKKLNKPIYLVIENIQGNVVKPGVTIILGTAQAVNHGFTYEKAMVFIWRLHWWWAFGRRAYLGDLYDVWIFRLYQKSFSKLIRNLKRNSSPSNIHVLPDPL